MTEREEKLQQFEDMKRDVKALIIRVGQLEKALKASDTERFRQRLAILEVKYETFTDFRIWRTDLTEWVKYNFGVLRQEMLDSGVHIKVDPDCPTKGNDPAATPTRDLPGNVRLQNTLSQSPTGLQQSMGEAMSEATTSITNALEVSND